MDASARQSMSGGILVRLGSRGARRTRHWADLRSCLNGPYCILHERPNWELSSISTRKYSEFGFFIRIGVR